MTAAHDSGARRTFQIDFALTVLAGNLSRYAMLRPLVESDPTIVPRWFPIRTWIDDDPLRFLPGALRLRARHMVDSWRLFAKPPADAAVIHALETYWLYVGFQRLLGRKVVIVENPDGCQVRSLPRKLAVARTDLFVPWSNWCADQFRQQFPEIPPEKLVVLHPGITLSDWPMRPPHARGERFRLLFVGGDYMRKGGDTLVTAFAEHLSATCDLDIATWSGFLPAAEKARIEKVPNLRLHLDLTRDSRELRELYQNCDCFVMPTNHDASPWVAIEALCTGIPVIISDVGGIPDIVENEVTGLLVRPKDPADIARAVKRLIDSPELVAKFVANGRAHVEKNFDANVNTRRFLEIVKQLVARRDGD